MHVRQEATQVKHLSGAPLLGRLLALSANNRLDCKTSKGPTRTSKNVIFIDKTFRHDALGIMTFSKMPLSITLFGLVKFSIATLSITTISVMTFSITILSITVFIMLTIKRDTQHNDIQQVAQCCFTDCYLY